MADTEGPERLPRKAQKPREQISREESLRRVELVRKLLKEYGGQRGAQNRIAKIVGIHRVQVSQIALGKTWKTKTKFTVEMLQIRYLTNCPKCRKCGRNCFLFTVGSICVECELLELEKKGLIELEGK